MRDCFRCITNTTHPQPHTHSHIHICIHTYLYLYMYMYIYNVLFILPVGYLRSLV